jgi:site-specific DNA recombinase
MANKKLKAVGYCRTSGEGQRDNTSIPNQKQVIESYCKCEGYEFVTHYVDESKSGAKIEGRDSFKAMIDDGKAGKFSVIFFYDTSRFSRDSVDFGSVARDLKNHGVFYVSIKGMFDNREEGNEICNSLDPGIAEYERININRRCRDGRISTIKAGKPWSGSRPFGQEYDKKSGKWYVTEKGKCFAGLLKRYAKGEKKADLCREFGFKPGTVFQNIRKRQIAGRPYRVPDKEGPIDAPCIPPLVSKAVGDKVYQRCEINKRFSSTRDTQSALIVVYC